MRDTLKYFSISYIISSKFSWQFVRDLYIIQVRSLCLFGVLNVYSHSLWQQRLSIIAYLIGFYLWLVLFVSCLKLLSLPRLWIYYPMFYDKHLYSFTDMFRSIKHSAFNFVSDMTWSKFHYLSFGYTNDRQHLLNRLSLPQCSILQQRWQTSCKVSGLKCFRRLGLVSATITQLCCWSRQ